jgi:hypothetical protein
MAAEVAQTARFTNPESLRDSIYDAICALAWVDKTDSNVQTNIAKET